MQQMKRVGWKSLWQGERYQRGIMSLELHIECRGGEWWARIGKGHSEVFPTPEDAARYLEKKAARLCRVTAECLEKQCLR